MSYKDHITFLLSNKLITDTGRISNRPASYTNNPELEPELHRRTSHLPPERDNKERIWNLLVGLSTVVPCCVCQSPAKFNPDSSHYYRVCESKDCKYTRTPDVILAPAQIKGRLIYDQDILNEVIAELQTAAEVGTIECQICKDKLNSITQTHTMKHGITLEQYRSRFPDAQITSDAVLSVMTDNNRRNNQARVGTTRPQEVIDQIKRTKAANPVEAWNKGMPMSDEQKANLSQRALERTADPDYVHPRLGAKWSDEHKANLSEQTARIHANRSSEEKRLIVSKRRETLEQKQQDGRIAPLDQALSARRRTAQQLEIDVILASLPDITEYPKPDLTETTLGRYLQKLTTIQSHDTNFRSRGYHITRVYPNFKMYDIVHSSCDTQIHVRSYYGQLSTLDEQHDKLCEVCHPKLKGISNAELEVGEFISSLGVGIKRNTRQVLQLNREVDIYVPSRHIGFEYNGNFWHSEHSSEGIYNMLAKSSFADDVGLRLIHILEDEWVTRPDICKAYIKRVLFEGTSHHSDVPDLVSTLDKEVIKSFMLANHIDGINEDVQGGFGVYREGELVAALAINNPTIDDIGRCQYTILQYAQRLDIIEPKLLSTIVQHISSNITNSELHMTTDNRWKLELDLEIAGFVRNGELMPVAYYVKSNSTIRYHANHIPLSVVYEFDKDLTTLENMTNLGYFRIWDCGHTKWILS